MDAKSLREILDWEGVNNTRHIKVLIEIAHIKSGKLILSEIVEDQIVTQHGSFGPHYENDQCIMLGSYLLPMVLNKAMGMIKDSIANKEKMAKS